MASPSPVVVDGASYADSPAQGESRDADPDARSAGRAAAMRRDRSRGTAADDDRSTRPVRSAEYPMPRPGEGAPQHTGRLHPDLLDRRHEVAGDDMLPGAIECAHHIIVGGQRMIVELLDAAKTSVPDLRNRGGDDRAQRVPGADREERAADAVLAADVAFRPFAPARRRAQQVDGFVELFEVFVVRRCNPVERHANLRPC